MLKSVVIRIEQRLKDLNLSASAASLRAGLSRDAIRNMQRGAKSGSRQGISTNTLAALASALETTPQWLLDGTPSEIDSIVAKLKEISEHSPTEAEILNKSIHRMLDGALNELSPKGQ